MSTIKRAARKLLETDLGRKLQVLYYRNARKALQLEIAKLQVLESGIDGQEKTPYIVLADGATLFGRLPSPRQRQLYELWEPRISSPITIDTFGVAIDAVMRYVYPHSLPSQVMPYSRRARRASFHRQHAETIDDMPSLSSVEKEKWKNVFALEAQEIFLDLGAYMGFGTVRIALALGNGSQIVAVEPDPDNVKLLKKNVHANRLVNVTVMPNAIWNQNAELTFYKTDRQANSLISGVVDSRAEIIVSALSTDNIVNDLGLKNVSRISVTLNGAEVEAIEGMRMTLNSSPHIRLSLAGWYKRDGKKISEVVAPELISFGFKVAVGREGGVLAWKFTA